MRQANLDQALGAYNATAQRALGAGGASAGGKPSTFASFLEAQMTGALDVSKASEAASVAAASGTADVQKVVEAVSAAELTLQKVTAVRDKVIGAYKEIMQMPI